MSAPCPACESAKTRTFGGGIYMLGCHGCQVRKTADAPKHVREQAYAEIEDAEAREAFKREVAVEYQRAHGVRNP